MTVPPRKETSMGTYDIQDRLSAVADTLSFVSTNHRRGINVCVDEEYGIAESMCYVYLDGDIPPTQALAHELMFMGFSGTLTSTTWTLDLESDGVLRPWIH